MLRKIVAMLLVLVMLGSVVTPAMAVNVNENKACNSCNSCSNLENKNVAVFELKGLEKSEALAKALANKNIRKLMNKLAKNGHKPMFSKATVNKLISERGEMVYVLIPFKVKEGYKAAGVGYVISENGYRAFATEIYEKDGKTYTNAYYVDSDGNVVVLSGDQNYWGCVSLCLAQFCADSPTYCEICGGFCYICIAVPDPWACGMCLACIGAPAAYCSLSCL